MRGNWTLPTVTLGFYWALFTTGDCDIMDTAHYPELGVRRLIWDVQNIRHSVLPDFGCMLDIGPTVDTAKWLPLSVQRTQSNC